MEPYSRLLVVRPGNLNGAATEIDLRNLRNNWIMEQVAKERIKYESHGISDDIIKKYYKNGKKRKNRKESQRA